MGAILPAGIGRAEAQPGFVDQSGGLESLAGSLAGEPGGGEFAQFVVNRREQFFSSFEVSAVRTLKNVGEVAHGRKFRACFQNAFCSSFGCFSLIRRCSSVTDFLSNMRLPRASSQRKTSRNPGKSHFENTP